MKYCNKCGPGETIEADSARGVSFCRGCGQVLENQVIVSDMQFSNSAATGFFLNQKHGQGALFAGGKSSHTHSNLQGDHCFQTHEVLDQQKVTKSFRVLLHNSSLERMWLKQVRDFSSLLTIRTSFKEGTQDMWLQFHSTLRAVRSAHLTFSLTSQMSFKLTFTCWEVCTLNQFKNCFLKCL